MKYKNVDDFIDDPFNDEIYARFVLNMFRFSATLLVQFQEHILQHKLFCTYNGKKYRITGASSLGDVFLHKDLKVNYGYSIRADINDLSNFTNS